MGSLILLKGSTILRGRMRRDSAVIISTNCQVKSK